MRVSPIGLAFASEDKVLAETRKSAEFKHNHPEGIKEAQAAALAVYLARTGHNNEAIRQRIVGRFGYDLKRTVDGIRRAYGFEISCQKTVPEAIVAFLDSESYEDAVRNAISLGGDSDTLGCITGGIAEAFCGGVPESIVTRVRDCLSRELLTIVDPPPFARPRDRFDRGPSPEHMNERLPLGLPHRQFVFTVPRILRPYFPHNRRLFSEISRLIFATIQHFYIKAANRPIKTETVLAYQTANDFLVQSTLARHRAGRRL